MTMPVGMTPKKWQALIEKRRKFAFLAACQWPLSWIIPARRHKHAADILYEIAHSAHERETARLLAEVQQGSLLRDGSRTLEGEELRDRMDSDMLGDYLLLAGYALECVLKGCLMAMFPDLVNDNKRLDRLVTTHDLTQLCHRCAIALSPEEHELIDVITRYIFWGKYSGPKYMEDMPSPIDTDDRRTKSLSIANPFHDRKVQTLVDEIYRRGYELLESLR